MKNETRLGRVKHKVLTELSLDVEFVRDAPLEVVLLRESVGVVAPPDGLGQR